MNLSHSSPEVQLGALADEFVDRLRDGQTPTIEQYAEEHPDLADEIRELFPTLLSVEKLGWDESARPPVEPPPPEQLGEYRVLRKIGAGGMGIVYEAEQESLGRHVALKTLPQSAIGSAENLRRFQIEARAAAVLHHPNIVPVFGVGQDKGIQFYAMQFIDGQGLDSILDELRLMRKDRSTERSIASSPVDSTSGHSSSGIVLASASTSGSSSQYCRNVARLGADVADALAYAHERGVLHRDIKPSNLLLDHQGKVWITDFGLAKTAAEELTRSRELVGTLRYMAPERFNGQSDVRSDIYSLGLTLYELLTFQPAYASRDRAELIRCISLTQPPPPRKLDSGIPKDLETIVLKSLEKDLASRYRNAAEMSDDLRRFLEGKPIVARRTSLRERTLMWCRRNPLAACLTAGLAALVLMLSVGYAVHVRTLRSLLNKTAAAKESEQRANAESQQQLLESLRSQAKALKSTATPGRRVQSFAAITSAANLLDSVSSTERHNVVFDLRNQAIESMSLIDVRPRKNWDVTDSLDRVNNPRWAFTRDIESYVSSNEDGDIAIRAVDDQRLLFRAAGIVPKSNPTERPYLCVSASDRFVAVFYTQDHLGTLVQVVDTQTGNRVLDEPARSVGEHHWKPLCFDPVEDVLYFATSKGMVRLDCLTGDQRCFEGIGPGRHLDISVDGKRMAFTDEQTSQVFVRSTETGRLQSTIEAESAIFDIKWSLDGRLIAAATRDSNVYVWSAHDDNPLVAICRGHTSTVRNIAFSRSGVLASSAWDQTTRLWNPYTGKPYVRLDRFSGFRFSRDSNWLGHVHAGNEVGCDELIESDVCFVLAGIKSQSGSTIESVAFSPDSKWLVSSSTQEGLRVWRTSDGKNVQLKRPYAESKTVVFDETGRFLFSSGSGNVCQWTFESDDDNASLDSPSQLVDVAADATTFLAYANQRVAFQPRGNVFAVQKRGEERPLWEMQVFDYVNDLSISPEGRWVALGTWQTNVSRVIDASSGELVYAREHAYSGSAPKFSPDGHWLAYCVDGAVELIRVRDWQPVHRLKRDKPGYPNVAFSKDMKWLAVSDLHHVNLVRFADMKVVAKMSDPFQTQLSAGHPGAPALAFSPDGTMLAVGTYRDYTLLWKLDRIRDSLQELGLDWQDEARSGSQDN